MFSFVGAFDFVSCWDALTSTHFTHWRVVFFLLVLAQRGHLGIARLLWHCSGLAARKIVEPEALKESI